jgi:hypothetical protein
MRKSLGKALIIGCSLAGAGALGPAAHADSTVPPAADVGLLGGVSFANNGIGGQFAWGATAHTRLMPNVDIGAYFSYYTNSVTLTGGNIAGASYNEHFAQLAGEINYHFDMVPGLYAGGKLGAGFQSNSLVNSTTSTHFLFGPAVGYDYLVGGGVSVGGQFNLLYETSSPNVTATTFVALVKYNFG